MPTILSLRALPLFACFFLWSFGTGGQQLARPLFAASFGVPLVLVTLVISSNAVSHLAAGPLTGFAMDRFGRRPLLMLGLVLRGASCVAEYFAGSYAEFLIYEFIGGLGVAMFITGSSVLLADLSVVENRGRAVAARTISSRLGFILGPAVGAAIATAFDLRSIFLFNAATKVLILIIVVWLIGETRPESAAGARHGHGGMEGLSRAMFLNRPFLVIALVALTFSMMNQGVFQAMVPVYAGSERGMSTAEIGSLMTIAATATLLVSYPNGYLVDLYGRKTTLVPGIALLSLAAYLLGAPSDQLAFTLTIVLYGVAEAACFGASQAYAMDLAPEHRRGSFLGVWSLVSNSGSALAPLLVGLVAERVGFAGAFATVGTVLAAVAAVMLFFGPDTRSRHSAAPASTDGRPESEEPERVGGTMSRSKEPEHTEVAR